jgi:hypothetical protein
MQVADGSVEDLVQRRRVDRLRQPAGEPIGGVGGHLRLQVAGGAATMTSL